MASDATHLDAVERVLREVSPGLEGTVWQRTGGNSLPGAGNAADPADWLLQTPGCWGDPACADRPGTRALLARTTADIAAATRTVDISTLAPFPEGGFEDAIVAGLKAAVAALPPPRRTDPGRRRTGLPRQCAALPLPGRAGRQARPGCRLGQPEHRLDDRLAHRLLLEPLQDPGRRRTHRRLRWHQRLEERLPRHRPPGVGRRPRAERPRRHLRRPLPGHPLGVDLRAHRGVRQRVVRLLGRWRVPPLDRARAQPMRPPPPAASR